jgi:hypothetical protein
MNPTDIPAAPAPSSSSVAATQARALDEIYVRMPTPDEVHQSHPRPGTPVAMHVITGFTGDGQPVRVAVNILPATGTPSFENANARRRSHDIQGQLHRAPPRPGTASEIRGVRHVVISSRHARGGQTGGPAGTSPRREEIAPLWGSYEGGAARHDRLGPCCQTPMALPAGSSTIATHRSPSG